MSVIHLFIWSVILLIAMSCSKENLHCLLSLNSSFGKSLIRNILGQLRLHRTLKKQQEIGTDGHHLCAPSLEDYAQISRPQVELPAEASMEKAVTEPSVIQNNTFWTPQRTTKACKQPIDPKTAKLQV